MSIPTVVVTCVANDQLGNPVVGARFSARLSVTEVYNGIVVPDFIFGTTDSTGSVALALWPNSLGTKSSVYRIRGEDEKGFLFLDAKAFVPNQNCQLHQILSPEIIPPMDAAVAAIIQAQSAVSTATAAASSAANSEATATAANISAIASAETASAESAIAQASATISQNSEATTTVASAAAVEAAAAALISETVASGARDTAVALAPFYGENPPPNPVENARWIYSITGDEFKWLVDEDSGQWVETGASISVGYATALLAEQAAASAASSAAQAEAAALSAGLSGATIDAGYNLVVTLGNGASFVVGYVRGEQGATGSQGDTGIQGVKGDKGDTGDVGAAFSVDHVGAALVDRDAFDDQPDGFSFLDAATGLLYFRQGVTLGEWSVPVLFSTAVSPGVTSYTELTDTPLLGTASALNVPVTGDAISNEVVLGNDSRLSDSRTPVTHSHSISQITDASEFGASLLTAENVAAAKGFLSLASVNNTADIDKPVSTATSLALATKQAELISGTNLKTVNGQSLLGSGNVVIEVPTGTVTKEVFDSAVGSLRLSLEGKQDAGSASIWIPKVISGANIIGATQVCAAGGKNYINFDDSNIISSDTSWLSVTKQGGETKFAIDVPAGKRVWWRFSMNILVDQSAGSDVAHIIGVEQLRKPSNVTDFHLQMAASFSPLNNYATVTCGTVVGIATYPIFLVPWMLPTATARIASQSANGFSTFVSLEVITIGDL